MVRSMLRNSLVAALAVTVTGCAKPTSTTPTPVNPATLVSVTEIFAGRLFLNGAVVYPFAVGNAGTVTATLNDLNPNPDGLAAIDLSLGVWNGTACGSFAVDNATAYSGTVMVANVAGSGTLCARVSDPNGRLADPLNYTLSVAHF
jgi:hypothetical protein